MPFDIGKILVFVVQCRFPRAVSCAARWRSSPVRFIKPGPSRLIVLTARFSGHRAKLATTRIENFGMFTLTLSPFPVLPFLFHARCFVFFGATV